MSKNNMLINIINNTYSWKIFYSDPNL